MVFNKCYPPQIDGSEFLARKRILENFMPHGSSHPVIILIQARAGQGKTTLIKQFLNQTGMMSAWYQVGPEDADPVLFLNSVSTCIKRCFKPTRSDAVVMLPATEDFKVFEPDLRNRLKLLSEDLTRCLKDDVYVVFDDLHELISHDYSMFVLKQFIETAPPKLHFILSSREPLPVDDWQFDAGNRRLWLVGNHELAMDVDEVVDFFHHTRQRALPQSLARDIVHITEGWVMGVRLIELQMAQQGSTIPLTDVIGPGTGGYAVLLDYFRREIFTTLAARLHRPFLVLSLLEEIPVDLAFTLTGEQGIGEDLLDLSRRHLFIRSLDAEQTVFGLHHLFRQFLREKAALELDARFMGSIRQQAGRFYLDRNDPAQALRYLLQAGDYDAIEAAIRGWGGYFLAVNQTATLTAILTGIPEPDLCGHGWSCLYLALAYMDSTPFKALPLLDNALSFFVERRDRQGELVSLVSIISIHITTTGHYREGEALLQRAEQLFFETAETLDTVTTIQITRSLAMGYCIFLGDTGEATRFASLALDLARKGGLVNFEAALLMVMGYIQIFAGNTPLARMYLEQAGLCVHRPEVGTFNSLSIRMMQFNFLFHDGDFENYFDQKNQMVAAIGNSLVSQSIAGPFCYVWEMDIAINQGDFDRALALAQQALSQQPPLSPHLLSQVKMLQSVVWALGQQPEKAASAAAAAVRLHDKSGGRYFTILNKLLSGVSHFHCGRQTKGLRLLGEGIEAARAMPTAYLEACGLLHRAALSISVGATSEGAISEADRDIRLGLALMRSNTYRHFWAWYPQAIQAVLGFAVAHGIEAEYARTLAADRLNLVLLDDGTAVPLLDFKTLGGFNMMHNGNLLLKAEDLTTSQRELLALLISAPELKLPQETLQLYFWPDGDPDAVRVKFDAMVSRLRKALAGVLPKSMSYLYLKREKGLVWLDHCHVDAIEFLKTVDCGLRHLRLQAFWQAGNAFTRAATLWQGEFAPGVAGEDRIRNLRKKLADGLAELALSWSDLLIDSDRFSQAVQITETALVGHPHADRLYSHLYRLQGRHSAVHARQVLKRYAAVLHAEDYTPDEIDELVAAITSEPTP